MYPKGNIYTPKGTIKYQLPENKFVKVEIFNTLGENVNTLVNQNQDAGEYTINWNGKSRSGLSLASGTYFYRIKAGSFVEVRKMMMIK